MCNKDDFVSANSVYMTDAPPPYPGINGYHGYANGAASAGAGLYRSCKL